MGRMPVELTPAVATAAGAAEDPRFTKGAIKSTVRWAAGAGATSARFTGLVLDADPPMLVAELHPAGERLVLYAGDSAWTREPQWVHRIEVPAGVWELDWLRSRLVEEAAAALGADITPTAKPEVQSSSEYLGQGETRRTDSVAWDAGPAHVTAQVDEHEIYDGATPAWGFLRGTVTGLPGGASVTVTANLAAGRRTATVTVSGRRRTSRPLSGRRSISPSGGGR